MLHSSSVRARIIARPYEEWGHDPEQLLTVARTYREARPPAPTAALPYLDAAEALLEQSADAEHRAEAALLRLELQRDLGRFRTVLDDLERHAHRWNALPLPQRVKAEAAAVTHRGIASFFLGRLTEALDDLEQVVRLDPASVGESVRCEALGCLALVEAFWSSGRSAHLHLAESASIHAEDDGPHLCCAPGRIATLLVAADRKVLDPADDRGSRLLGLVEGTPYEGLLVHILTALARERGDVAGALEGSRRLRDLHRHWEDPALLAALHARDRFETALQLGDFGETRAALEALGEDPAHLGCRRVLAARLALEGGRPSQVVALTRACLDLGDDHPARTLAEAVLLDAAARSMLGDDRSAEAGFQRALHDAEARASRQAFAVLPPPVLAEMCARLRETGETSHPLLDDLACPAPPSIEGRAGDASLSALTPREVVVLSEMEEGRGVREIAMHLSVSPNTVKTQIRTVYRKLGVSSRAGALQRARVLGLLAA